MTYDVIRSIPSYMQDENERWYSQSENSDSHRCPYRYKLVHIDNVVRRFAPAPLRRGTLVHKGLEAALRERLELPAYDFEAMCKASDLAIVWAQDEWLGSPEIKPFLNEDIEQGAADQIALAQRICVRVLEFLGDRFETVRDPDGTPMIEYAMRVRGCLPEPWTGFQGTIDWVARERSTGHVWLFDFKTRKTPKGPEYDVMQAQAPAYQYLLERTTGIRLVGTATLEMRAEVEKRPKRNKTKKKTESVPGMSRSAVACTWRTYCEALEAEGLDPADYLDMKAKLPESFDVIHKVFRGENEVATIWQDIYQEAAEIGRRRHWPRAISPYNCQGCSHRTYCQADLHGEDLEFLLETDYAHRNDNRYTEIQIEGLEA